jgi:hypothetical protein
MSTEFSPSSRPTAAQRSIAEYSFGQALSWLLDPSKAIRRVSWIDGDAGDMAYLSEGYLMILRGDKESVFVIHSTDIRGNDWIVIDKPKLNYASAPAVQSAATDSAEPQKGSSDL